jgi:endogenous inhibitor of DNA gyrase (YacG/DUF329 family)/very-short-patch-repair endonuclease
MKVIEKNLKNITNKIKKKYVRYEWKIIGGKKKWIRNCPTCNKEILYLSSENTSRANKNKSVCKECRYKLLTQNWYKNHHLKSILPKDLNRNCPKCDKIIVYKNKRCKLKADRKNQLCRSCSRSTIIFGPMNEIQKKKISISHIKRMKKFSSSLKSSFNPKACEYFNNINKEKHWNLKHALNDGEKQILNYFLDAYDERLNIVVEYDEHHHNYPKQKLKDIKRMNEIINHLHCKFYRYNEKTKELKEYELE